MGKNVKRKPGEISEKTIRKWLDNYQALVAEDKTLDDMPRNSGCKPDDGIADAFLNRIMLETGLDNMKKEAPILFYCCRARWIIQARLGKTIRHKELTKDQYYRRCDWAVRYLYYDINGKPKTRRKLARKVFKVEWRRHHNYKK